MAVAPTTRVGDEEPVHAWSGCAWLCCSALLCCALLCSQHGVAAQHHAVLQRLPCGALTLLGGGTRSGHGFIHGCPTTGSRPNLRRALGVHAPRQSGRRDAVRVHRVRGGLRTRTLRPRRTGRHVYLAFNILLQREGLAAAACRMSGAGRNRRSQTPLHQQSSRLEHSALTHCLFRSLRHVMSSLHRGILLRTPNGLEHPTSTNTRPSFWPGRAGRRSRPPSLEKKVHS
jgi:hypothetical protein